LYIKEGFSVQSQYQMFFRTRPSTELIALCSRRRPYYIEDEATVYALNREMSGEDRSGLLKHMMRGVSVYIEDDILKGIYLPDAGEGLICASTREAAASLLAIKTAAQVHCVALPEENRDGQTLLQKIKFTKTFQVRRMILGEPFEWNPLMNYSRLSGYSG